ncbi:MAG: single-stranded DNA-binding protein [Cryomorphaceae bacterium]|jgi:hypothetical protein|nr:single-stranded DNA-binding protein [Cryomorphaceae bacterium]|tara:strand:+ start:3011 stop:3898 length:888 start_codon:yes stop_codon:yes gene_type:complete
MSFADLKKQSRAGSLTEKLMKKVEKLNEKGSGGDDRLWKPSVDKAGNGYAVIRFLPAHTNCELPWNQVWSHAFQGPGGWYIENSLTTIGKDDPVGELNRSLWNSGNESDKEIARKQKRKLSYYANVYVVKDASNPDNEGKVFLYKFGKKIFDKITASMQPEFEDEEPINPFDFWKGANFKLKIKQVAGYWNYDSSEFGRVEPLLEDDTELEVIYNQVVDLSEFTSDDKFKTYDALKKRLDAVLGRKQQLRAPDPEVVEEETLEDLSEGRAAVASTEETDEDADDALSYFQKLAED